MKKTLLFATLAALLMLTGCGKDEPRADYKWILKVTNETDREIVITNSAAFGYGEFTITIPPDHVGTVAGRLYEGPAENDGPMRDILADDDILPFGDAFTTQLPAGEYWVEMTVGGEAVPGAVWTRKHWSFASDNFSRTYSLTVTDEFLAGFESLEPGQ